MTRDHPLRVCRVRFALLVIASFVGLAPPSAQGGQNATPPIAAQQEPHAHATTADQVELFPRHEASGTAWQPETTPMRGFHETLGNWQIMLHGNGFAQFLYEPGDRHRTGGAANDQFSSVKSAALFDN